MSRVGRFVVSTYSAAQPVVIAESRRDSAVFTYQGEVSSISKSAPTELVV